MCARKSLFIWRLLAAMLVVGLVAPYVAASEPVTQTTAPGFDPQDDVLRILTTAGNGTGTVIGKMVSADGTKEFICLVTADHVVNPGVLSQLGYRSDRGPTAINTFNVTPLSSVVFHGGPTLRADYAFIGATIDLTTLTPLQSLLLQALQPVGLAPAPAANGAGTAPAANFNFTEIGYGRSGRFDAAFNAATGQNFAYVWHSNVADEQYGIERTFANTVTTYGNFNGGGYTYASESWFLRNAAGGAIPNEGQGNSGDSGAGLMVNGNIEGILTNVWGDNMRNLYLYTDGLGNRYEGFLIGSEGLGVRFSQADINWLREKDVAYCAPEPGSLILLGIGGTILVFRSTRLRAFRMRRSG
jgi:hypothetical protein